MTPPSSQADEASRLEALAQYRILDTLPEQCLDDLTALATHICEAPIGLISLVDEHRQWFKSRVGMTATETARDISFCQHTILQRDLFIVPDATQDPRFAGTPLVVEDPQVRFYAGAPLVTPDGHALGALCVMDRIPRQLTAPQQEALRILGRQVMSQLELRRQARSLVETAEQLRVVTDNARIGLVVINSEHRYVYANGAYATIFDLPSSDIIGKRVAEILPAVYEEQIRPRLDQAFSGQAVAYDLHRQTSRGERFYAVRYELVSREPGQTLVIAVISDITDLKTAQASLSASGEFAQSTIDSLSAHICVLDESGSILATNAAWRRFAQANPPLAQHAAIDDNYLAVCDAVRGTEASDAAAFAAGIRATIRGERSNFELEYSCHSPSEKRWFVGKVTRFASAHPPRVVISHENITERKLSELSLARLAAIVESSDDAIIGKDLDGLVTSWNRGAEKIFGFSEVEMVGSPILKIIPPERYDEEALILNSIARGQSIEHFETIRQTKTGRRIDISVTASPIRDASGKVVGVSKVARDISQKKRAQEILREREEQLLLYARYSPAAIAMFDRQMRYIVASNRWMETYRLSGRSIIGRSHYEVFPEIPQRWKDIHARCLAGAVESCDEDPFPRADGSLDWIRWEVRPWRQADGAIGGIVIFSEDITRRKHAESARKESEQRYRTLFECAPDGIAITDSLARFLHANAKICKMLGYTPEELLQLNATDIVAPSQLNDLAPALELIKSGASYQREWTFRRKDGSEFQGEAIAAVMPDGNLLAIIRDTTERKKLEQQFLRAQRMESIGTLAGGIAHDLNNVLAPILMSVEILKEFVTDERGRAFLETLYASATRGSALVKQVLSFGRGIHGERVRVNPVHIIRELMAVMRETFPKSIDVTFKCDRDIWTVMGDPTQMHQVFLNLCVNARDAMPTGGTLEISLENAPVDETYAAMNIEARPGPYVVVSVADSGSGIPADIRERIFEPFFTTKEVGKGTGLGLSTTLAIVKAHNGFINVYSEPGKGTRFKIYFPANPNETAEGVPADDPHELPRGHGELVLVVDDEAALREIVEGTLERFGYRVLLAKNGAEAVALYAQHRSDISVVLTDMAMPILDGPATIIALKSINPEVRVIGTSGLSVNENIAKALEAGVQHFVPKPYTAETMLKALRVTLGTQRNQP